MSAYTAINTDSSSAQAAIVASGNYQRDNEDVDHLLNSLAPTQGLPSSGRNIPEKMKAYVQQKKDRASATNSKQRYNPNICSRYRALCCLQTTLQWRKYCTNICQVIFPLIMLLLPSIASIIATYQPVDPSSPVTPPILMFGDNFSPNVVFRKFTNCCYQNASQSTDIPCFQMANTYSVVNPTHDERIGELSSIGKKSGLLGNSPQTRIMTRRGQQCLFTPYFYEYDSIKKLQEDANKNYTIIMKSPFCRSANRLRCRNDPTTDFSEAAVWFKTLDFKNYYFDYDIFMHRIAPGNPTIYENLQPMGLIHFINSALGKQAATIEGGDEDYYSVGQVVDLFTDPIFSINIPKYISDMGTLILYPISISFLMPSFMSAIIHERTQGLMEVVKLYGVSDFDYGLVRFVFNYMLYLSILAITCIVGFAFKFRFFYYAEPGLYIPLFLLWGISQLSLSNFFARFFTNTTRATVFGYLFMLASLLIGAIISGITDVSVMPPFYFMLYPPFAFNRTFAMVLLRFMHSTPPSTETIVICFAYLIASTLLVLVLSSNILYAVPLFVYKKISNFCIFQLVKLKQRRLAASNNAYGSSEDHHKNASSLLVEEDEECIQELLKIQTGQVNEDALVVIDNLVKTFYSLSSSVGTNFAVDGLNLTLRDNEVFGLLGENGAGKSTALQMICGNLEPTSGNIYIAGYRVNGGSFRELARSRQYIGVCPQFDILFDNLTVEEHLLFFSRLRGVSILKERAHVKQIIEDVGLEEARRRNASKLSGGMKRRLSIAIALVGDPYVVFLDEPTSGLDPASRRGVWEIVMSARKNRCIVLTTHSMEEAEALCSRIGILTKGKLRTLGNTIQLKNKYGSGYKLTVSCDSSNFERIHQFLVSMIPNIELTNTYGISVFYRVKTDDIKLSTFFAEMNKHASRIGIKDWSINQASLEEVFLKLTQDNDEEQVEQKSAPYQASS